MFSKRKDLNAFRDGQRNYAELAHHGLFEGPARYSRSLCLQMMCENNPHPKKSRVNAKWEDGWLQRAGIHR